MTVIRNIIMICFAASIAAACGENYDQLERDRTSIESFLSNRVEYDVVDNVYRYVENSDRDGYAQATVAANGDQVEFYYEGYMFNTNLSLTSGNYNPAYIFATNRPQTLDFLTDRGLMGNSFAWNRTVWPEDPIQTTVGNSSLVDGVAIGLRGCREGDHVWMFFASDLGFGSQLLGTVPKNQILAYRIYVENVTKN